MKGIPFFKASYVTVAWLVVTVGLPAMAGDPTPGGARVTWACGILGPALLANAIAFSARDAEAAAARLGVDAALRGALVIAAAGSAVGIGAPAGLRGLAAVPAATAAALAAFRGDERYVEGVVDGALVVGAIAASLLG